MSAPKTNIETEKRRHRGPLVVMFLSVAAVLALLVLLVGWLWLRTDGPEGADTQVDVPPPGMEETE